MKAIRVAQFGGPEVLKVEDIPQYKPGVGEVLMAVKAAGVNPVEIYIRSGSYARKPVLPYTPGTDAAGIIEAVGEGVSRFRPGDRVYSIGSLTGVYAEHSLCKVGQVFPLPPSVDFTQGAALGIPYATAYQALFNRAHARAGEWLLVHGASGGVGVAACQLAIAFGLRIIGTAGADAGIKLVADQGIQHVLNHQDPQMPEKVMDITGGRGVDMVLEMLANQNLGVDLTMLAMGGRAVVIGCRGKVEINPRDAMQREASIIGMSLFNATEAEIQSIHAALGAGLATGILKPLIGRQFPLAEAAKAQELVMAPGARGKIILVP
jgi:NADPH:quinone reductase